LIILIIFYLQATLVGKIGLLSNFPDLLTILLVLLFLDNKEKNISFSAFLLICFFADIISSGVFGTTFISWLIAGWILYKWILIFSSRKAFVLFSSITLFILISRTLEFLISDFRSTSIDTSFLDLHAFGNYILFTFIYTIIISIFILPFQEKIYLFINNYKNHKSFLT
jgi:hypothetical protein